MHGTMQPPVLPAAFTEKMKDLLGQEWEQFLECYEKDRYQALRFNPLKKGLQGEDCPEILRRLHVNSRTPVPWARDAFYYKECRGADPESEICQPGAHPYHEMGLYYIQEPSAMSAAELLAPRPGERVLDLCAAPGGKSTQMASFMKQQGLLVANEIHPARCKILSQNMERMGIANGIVTNEDSGKLAEYFPLFFDRILVDAPCSGEGMFRKAPEAISEWSPRQVESCANRQAEILQNAARMLRLGGKMVYSTCTFSPEENERTIGNFLKEHPEFEIVETDAPYFAPGRPEWADGNPELEKTFRLWPHRLCGEGHFAAVLRKKMEGMAEWTKEDPFRDPEQERSLIREKRGRSPGRDRGGRKSAGAGKPSGLMDASQRASLKEFLEEACTRDTVDWIMEGSFVLFGDQLYRLPEYAPSLAGLHVLRAGLHIGTFKKNRMEPSHALALCLGKEDVKNPVNISAEAPEAAAFFRGETISAQGKKGWCLVCVDGYSAGWGKLADGVLKNHYPKGLRRTFCHADY